MATEILRPNAAGDLTELTASPAVDNYLNVDEETADGDTTNVHKAGQHLYICIKENSVVTDDEITSPTTDYATYSKQWTTRPSDSGAWTSDDIESLQIGVGASASPGSADNRDLYNVGSLSIAGTPSSITVYVVAKRIIQVIYTAYFTQVYVEVVTKLTYGAGLTSYTRGQLNKVVKGPIGYMPGTGWLRR